MGLKKRPTISTCDELERQLDVYIARHYPSLAGMSTARFRSLFSGLVGALIARVGETVSGRGPRRPFALIVTRDLISPEERVPLLTLAGSPKPGIVDRNHWSDDRPGLAPYAPIRGLGVPDGSVSR